VSLVAIVLVRRTERASSLDEAGDCNGAGMRGVLMGEARLKTSLHHAVLAVKRGDACRVYLSAGLHADSRRASPRLLA
jgi:hypothetical protein